MADKACHVVGSTSQVGLTQALGLRAHIMVTDTDEHFYERADAHIHLASDHTTDIGRGKVSASFLYGAARFNIYVAAFNCDSKDHMISERQRIRDYYAAEYTKMIVKHLDDYIDNYDVYLDKSTSRALKLPSRLTYSVPPTPL